MSVVSCSPCRGFTVIELLVTMAIFSVLTGVVLARYRDYTTNASFANASENIVLALRQAQVYGAGGKQSDTACLTSFYMCHYGVSFTEGKNFFTMFVDSERNQIFDSKDTILETISFESPIVIDDLSCGTGPCLGGDTMNITFARPSPDALIIDNNVVQYTFGKIVITNGQKDSTITISRAGQISIE